MFHSMHTYCSHNALPSMSASVLLCAQEHNAPEEQRDKRFITEMQQRASITITTSPGGAHYLVGQRDRDFCSQIVGRSGRRAGIMAKLNPAQSISRARAMSGCKVAQCASFRLEASDVRMRGGNSLDLSFNSRWGPRTTAKLWKTINGDFPFHSSTLRHAFGTSPIVWEV
ncbi:hypothetical protein PMIN03_009702 [Paraphaeosphaeria minitans]